MACLHPSLNREGQQLLDPRPLRVLKPPILLGRSWQRAAPHWEFLEKKGITSDGGHDAVRVE